jgi:hypothetical protein
VFVCGVGPVVCAVVGDDEVGALGFFALALFGGFSVGGEIVLGEVVGERHGGLWCGRVKSRWTRVSV